MTGCVKRQPGLDPNLTGDVIEKKPGYDDAAKWDRDFCRAKWGSQPAPGTVFDTMVYLNNKLKDFYALFPLANYPAWGSKSEKIDFDGVRNAVPARKIEAIRALIDQQNLPFSESKPLIANRLGVPGIEFHSTRPATRWLFEAVQRDAFIVVLELKKHFNRARPYQRVDLKGDADPWFYPGHPSYPSGHALDAAIVVGICKKLWIGPVGSYYGDFLKNIEKAADDYGYLREVAGVHYPSDTAAGKQLAEMILQKLSPLKSFEEDLERARKEWGTAKVKKKTVGKKKVVTKKATANAEKPKSRRAKAV
jgi:hypothetical protein